MRSKPWNFKDRVVLMGDAAHAIVPFFGQVNATTVVDCVYSRAFLVSALGSCGFSMLFAREPVCHVHIFKTCTY